MPGIISRGSYCWQLARTSLAMSGAILLAGCWVSIFSGNAAFAQITPDETLGTEGSVVNPGTINGLSVDLIEGGASRDANLFHSFEEFNVRDGQRVYFANPAAIDNILSRVTGTDASDILGTLGVNGAANLFLLNPNGIIFGENARLDIKGSFVAATANSILSENGIEYSAINPEAPPLLTVTVPIGLQYGNAAQDILVQQSNLEMPNGKTLMLVGGNVSLDGGVLQAPGGRVELGGVGGVGTIELSNDLRLSFPDSVARADVNLTNGSDVNVRADGGGSITINAQNLTIAGLNRSSLKAGIAEDSGSVNAVAGDIEINATGVITIEDASFISNSIEFGGSGQSGNINIKTRLLSATDGSQIYGSTRANGNAGNITIQAEESISFDGQMGAGRSSGAVSEVESSGVGKGGTITITTPSLSITNGGTVTTGISGRGDGGSVIINADTIFMDGQGSEPDPAENGAFFSSGVYSRIQDGGEGNPGSITIMTRLLSVNNGSVITTSTEGKGSAGSVIINADQVMFDGDGRPNLSGFIPSSGAFSAVKQGAEGDAGNIDITADSLSLTNGGVVTTMTLGRGDAGTVNIKADTVSFDGQGSDFYSSGIYNSVGDATVTSIAFGNAGDVNITAGSLSVTNGAQVTTSTFGQGDAGRVTINADTVSFDGVGQFNPNLQIQPSSGAYSTVNSDAVGKGGGINLTAIRLLSLTNGAQLQANTFGEGSAGNIQVNNTDSIILSGVGGNGVSSGIFTSTEQGAVGQGGEISVDANTLRIEKGAVVNARTLNVSRGGSVNINANTIEAINGGQVITTTRSSGNAGSIVLNGDKRITLSGSDPRFAERLAQFGEDIVVNEDAASGLFANTQGSGNAGDLTVSTGQLIVQQGAQVSAYTRSAGAAGKLNVIDADSVEVIGTSSDGQTPSRLLFDSSGSGEGGNAGELTIDTNHLMIKDGGLVSATTSSTGEAGILDVNASDSVQIIGTSANGEILSSLLFDTSGSGNAGLLTINTDRLIVQDGAKVSAITSSTGDAGKLTVNAADSVQVIGTAQDGQTSSSLLFNSSGSGEGGDAGELTIDTNRLIVKDGGLVSATTSSTGEAGILDVNASDSVQIIGTSTNGETPSRLLFDSSGAGNAGELTINTNRLLIQDGGQVSAATSGSGQGGIIDVNAAESVDVSGTSTNGQFASGLYFDSRSSGNARGIKINTGELTVQNGGQISVSGSNSGISGDLDITADSISLTNQGHLITTTAATEGGNIRLNVNESIILRYNSEISAEASNNGNGGNIDITAGDFILAILSENSDIVANAYAGNGGNINATAAGVFGFRQFEERRTPESDFIASSFLGIDGTTTINTQDVQPVPLPEQPGVPPISEGCQANRNPETGDVASSQFYNTGRGGLPPNPSDALTSNTPQVPWVTLKAETQTPPEANSADEEPLTEIAEAQGWVRLPNGEVMLTTQSSDLTKLPYCGFGSHE